jgi:small-conductance mechanosensitive channel
VLNHTFTSKDTRMAIPVQVSYDSDVDRALQLMAEAALAEPRVKRAPNAPASLVVRFAESGIDLELGVWIGDPENGQGDLRSSLNRAILRSFDANGIRIPYPQRELRILNVPESEATPVPGAPTRPDSPA